MFKRYLLLISAFAIVISSMESCFLQKNRCDACPSHAKHKRVKKSSKGSI